MEAIDLASVCRIIYRAKEFDAAVPLDANSVEDELPAADHSPYDNLTDNESLREDTAAEEIRQFVGDMNVDQRAELVALAWVGRGTFGRDEWGEAVRMARQEHSNRTADYLLEMPLLANHLEEGLASFDLNCGD